MNKSKVDFIADLLSEKRLNTYDKEKLFHLASKELKNLETTDEDLRKKVEALEEKINGENPESKKIDRPKKQGPKLPHDPKATVEFLRLFKYHDGSGFKELIHDVDFEVMGPDEIIEKVTTHPNFISTAHHQKVVGFKPIHGPLQQNVKELIDRFINQGKPYILKRNQHPFERDKEYTDFAKNFKKKYRFGSGRDYTELANLILNIANDEKYQHIISPNNIEFLPDRRKFDIRANFFTWMPSIRNGIYFFLEGVKDHGNIKGDTFQPEDKTVKIECWKKPDEKVLFVSFLDQGTVVKRPKEKVLHSLQKSPALNRYFWSLCDWHVEADFEEDKSCRLKVLEKRENKNSNKEIIFLNQEVGGFKHVLKFYDL